MYYLRQLIEALLYPLRALLTSPGKVTSSARRLAAISLPARISILVAMFLVFVVFAVYFAFLRGDFSASFFRRPREWIGGVILVIAIPIVLYYVLRLWLEGEVSRFPDIDYAWKAGLAELRAHGLDLEFTPLFLILGSSGEALEKTLFGATQLPLRVREIPTGAAALHWFAEPNGIYLVCTDVGCLSKLAAIAKRAAEDAKARQGKTIGGTADNRHTMAPGDLRGTMMTEPEPQGGDESSLAGALVSQVFPTPAPSQQPRPITGTFIINQETDDLGAREVEQKPVSLPQDVQREQELRLEYLCRLIVKARQPLAPLNGVLTLLPYSIVQTGRREGTELQRAVKRDLNTLVRQLKLRCPVTSLVIGMEEESGFREMIRRLPKEAAANQRYGKGFSVGNPPIPEQLEAVAAHACGLFEATTYQLFREKGSLGKPGNMKLYALLCKIRRTVRAPLTNVLMNGYAHDPDDKKEADMTPLFFNGCYFAAVGEAEQRQAFVKGVVDMLPRDQEELEWTEAALDEDDRYHRWSQAAMWIDFVLLLGLAGMSIYAFWPK